MNPASMPNDDALEELTSQAADEFMEQLGRGEEPDVEEVVARHPEIAGVLRRLLPALQAMREANDGTGPELNLPPVEMDGLGRLGDFEIVREVGRGGMGIVYESVQISLGRRVALKVLPFASMLDPQRLQRFQNEARAAACLHHNNIVPIFAVGCDRGVHFYAMQFIEGRNLAALVQDARRQAGLASEDGDSAQVRAPRTSNTRSDEERGQFTPRIADPAANGKPSTVTEPAAVLSTQRGARPSVPIQTVARLAVQAAEALHHAHQEGVVHRDVKPANMMVDANGNLWVTDFGLAQVQSDPRLTTTGNLIGTLRYMSPEQASGNQVVDHRTDLFSLGSTLYELLALQPAFPGRDRAALLRQIAQEEPPALRRVNPSVPADLETIVNKAMAKSPSDRYDTAQALADDLRRFLDDKPILAKRPSLLEKASKWARRRRGLVAAAVLLLIFAVCSMTTSTALIAGAYAELANQQSITQKEKEKATRAYEAETKEREKAEDAAWKARQVLNFFTQVSEDEFPDRPELRPVRRKLLEAALGYYKDFIDQQGDDPSVQKELDESRWRVASLLEEIGAKEEALAVFEQVRADLHFTPVPAIPGLPAWMGPSGVSVCALMKQPSVRKDLKLSDDQVRTLAALTDKRRDNPFSHHGPGDEGHRDDDGDANEKACFEVLRPEQAKRLRQIVWQQRGAHVFGDPDVADDLQLTGEQRERLHKIEEDSLKAYWTPQPGRPGEHRPPEAWKKPEDYWKRVNDRLLAVLTDEQKAKWREMTGEPFQGEIRFGSTTPNLLQGLLHISGH